MSAIAAPKEEEDSPALASPLIVASMPVQAYGQLKYARTKIVCCHVK
jgi:hypothetical protein